MHKIGIVILATNAYFILGIRFIKKFIKHYKGDSKIVFYFFSDRNPLECIPENINVNYINISHGSWVDATNDKFRTIISLEKEDIDYLYYFDADTNVSKDFTEKWFIGDLVGGEHFGNRNFLKGGVGYDKNPLSKAYIPSTTTLPKIYYYGAFFGGKLQKVIDFCKTLRNYQLEDKKINYEPAVNDESYINKYFHYNAPTLVKNEDFVFDISDKGGLHDMRNVSKNVEVFIGQLVNLKDKDFDLKNGNIILNI